jgi:hypothetical protein
VTIREHKHENTDQGLRRRKGLGQSGRTHSKKAR